jgi:hypothetical protein
MAVGMRISAVSLEEASKPGEHVQKGRGPLALMT